MKTFDEAIQITCLAKTGDFLAYDAITDKQVRSMGIIKEVVNSIEADFLADCLLKQMTESSFELVHLCVKNAIAQGVLIGMEMEKAESPFECTECTQKGVQDSNDPNKHSHQSCIHLLKGK